MKTEKPGRFGGTVKLARPLAPGVSRVPDGDPTFTELAAVLCGVKPAIFTDCEPGGLKPLARLCGRLRLEMLDMGALLSRRGHHFSSTKKMLLIGRDASVLARAARAWDDSSVKEEWGTLLGYPECCVRAYCRWVYDRGRALRTSELVSRIISRTTPGAALDFRLNNIWNYFSRMAFQDRKDCSQYRRLMDLNRETPGAFKNVISWHPCSYECRASRARAGEIYSFVAHHAPAYAAALRESLARPVLFWGKFRYAFLRGSVAGGWAEYGGLAFPRTLLDAKLRRLLEACCAARPGPRGLELRGPGGRPLQLKLQRPALLDFTGGTCGPGGAALE